jgi:hypothetical protein
MPIKLVMLNGEVLRIRRTLGFSCGHNLSLEI